MRRRLCYLGLLLCLSCAGPRVRVIPADQMETVLSAGQAFRAPVSGVFMSEARYLRYRRAVADRIQELEKP